MADPIPRPLGMLAELTHRCPLHCPYCSNPVELTRREAELDTAGWRSVLTQAHDLGVLQVHFSGGEPLSRADLAPLVAHAHDLGCYVNLVTSGLALTEARTANLVEHGLDHVQLSIQDSEATGANRLAGAKAHDRKLAAADTVRRHGLALTVNVVLHRRNLDAVEEIISLGERMGADRLELAHTQYYGWALRNRAALLPTRDQLRHADRVVRDAKRRLTDRMDLVYVAADYYADYPKPCMHGWGSRQLTVAPDGTVLPCPAATVIAGLRLEKVTRTPLAEIWYDSESFNAFRGTDWMHQPCRSCPRRHRDLGGCRCQAYQLTGDAAATDPVCVRSPQRGMVDALLTTDHGRQELAMRTMPTGYT